MSALEFDFAPLEAPDGLVANSSREDEAAELLAAARREAGAIRSLAHAEGLAAGREQALAELEPAAAALVQAAAEAREQAQAAADRLEVHAVDLALFLAEKVVGAAVAVEPALVV
jgi:flagellar biosynthesis/type III secretory pathway protein FliH